MREGATVLIVEDQEQLATAYSNVLEEAYDVRIATSGTAALERIDDDVDVVLLDRRMPGLSGDEVLRRLADRESEVAVAMITAVEPGPDLVDLPLDEYVAKPVDNDELLALVESLLERVEYDDQRREAMAVVAKQRALERADREATDAYDDLAARRRHLAQSVDLDEPTDPRSREW